MSSEPLLLTPSSNVMGNSCSLLHLEDVSALLVSFLILTPLQPRATN